MLWRKFALISSLPVGYLGFLISPPSRQQPLKCELHSDWNHEADSYVLGASTVLAIAGDPARIRSSSLVLQKFCAELFASEGASWLAGEIGNSC